MNKMRIKSLAGVVAGLCGLAALPVWGAELLDVSPVVTNGALSVDVNADIPMTYTYYKLPGEARAVVDIADADPEKVEPLIVVNKGAVSSISVDKVSIASMTVSRLVFNLVAETDIAVSASPDRKKLTVSFGKGGGVVTSPASQLLPTTAVTATAAAPKEAPAVTATPTVKEENDPLAFNEQTPTPAKQVVVATPAKEEDDPLGLDSDAPAAAAPKASPAVTVPVTTIVPMLSTAAATVKQAAVASQSSVVNIQGIVIGTKSVDIQTSGVAAYKTMQLDNPPRLVIDLQGVKTVKGNSFPVGRFGVEKVRVGNQGGAVRVVFDSRSATLPHYTVSATDSGVRVLFK